MTDTNRDERERPSREDVPTTPPADSESTDVQFSPQDKRTRGGTHVQHVTAGKKGGSRIRELIELGYKYEQEHGIGPGRSERAKIAANRRAKKDKPNAEPSGS